MKRLVGIVGAGVLLGVLAGASPAQDEQPKPREKVPLTEAVKRVVENSEVMESLKGEAEESYVQGAGMDSTDVASGLLDEVLLAPDPYYYESLGRRDPFVSLVMEDEDTSEMELSPNSIWVVGVLWGEKDKFALVETADGTSAILRQGDRFRNAEVTSIRKDGITLYVRQYGIGRALVLPLTEGKGSKNGKRQR